MRTEFVKRNSKDTLILLHGTGGHIDDLIHIANQINPEANLLMLEGDVLEYGQRRYFKRYMDGSYDISDLDKRAKKLNNLVQKLSKSHGFDLNRSCYVGYSNGANIILYTFLNLNPVVTNLISFHGMLKNMGYDSSYKPNLNVYFSIGMYDPLTTYKASIDSLNAFEEKKINLVKCITHEGHQITQNELIEAKHFYNQIMKKT